MAGAAALNIHQCQSEAHKGVFWVLVTGFSGKNPTWNPRVEVAVPGGVWGGFIPSTRQGMDQKRVKNEFHSLRNICKFNKK